MIGRPPNTLQDVWKYVDKRGHDECWPWTGALRRGGYGAFTLKRRGVVASRAAFHSSTGIDPGTHFVCHSCDNPACCNPAHLFLGSATDNVRDMNTKGRGRPPKGSSHWSTRLTEDAVRDIRRRRSAGEKLNDLSSEYGVSASRLSVIVNHPDKAWSHV